MPTALLVRFQPLLLGVLVGFGCARQEPPRQAAKEGVASAPALPGAPEKLPVPALPDPLPGSRRDVTAMVGSTSRAGAGDLDGDGRPELVLVDAEHIRVLDLAGRELARAPAPGGIQVFVVTDVDADQRAEIVAGWGATREHAGAAARVTLHRLERHTLVGEVIAAPPTTRQDVAAIIPPLLSGAPDLLLAYFESKYVVKTVRARRGPAGWALGDVGAIRMATSYVVGDVDGDDLPDLVVGRVYGDARDTDGDAFLLRPSGARVPIPTTRGVRALAVADADADGVSEIYMGDGWHQNYGRHAQGLLTATRWRDGAFVSELIEDTPGQFTIWRILPADVDGDGRPELVTQGSHYVRVYRLVDDKWRGLTIAGASRDVAVGGFEDRPGDDILIIGDRSEIVSLHGVTWQEPTAR